MINPLPNSTEKASSSFFFVEDLDQASLNLLKGGEIISLSPKVSFFLEKNSLSYSLLENYYQEKELRSDEEKYFLDQREWFRVFDEFLKTNIEECKRWNLRLASIHYNRFKYLIDSFIFRSRILQAFFENAKASRVTYLLSETPEEEGMPSLYNFYRKDRVSYWPVLSKLSETSLLTPVLITKKNIPSFLKKRAPVSAEIISELKLLGREVAERLSLKSIYNFKRYQKTKMFFLKEKDFQNITALFLDSGVEAIDSVARGLMNRGAKVFLKNEDGIYLLSSLFESQIKIAEQNDISDKKAQIYFQCKEAFKKLAESDLLNWVGDRSSFDVKPLILPYFEHFLTVICPCVLMSAQEFRSFYSRERVDFVIARGSAGENYPAPLLAAENEGVKRICFQHGVDPTDTKDWVVDELDFFDFNFAMEGTSCDYFKIQAKQGYAKPCQVFESSHYLKHIQSQQRKRALENSQNSNGTKEKAEVFYIPAKLAKGMIKFNGVIYPMTWYFEHQKALLTFFSQKSAFNFVYKHSPQQIWAEDSIFPWLGQRRFENISIEEGPFTAYFSRMARVIFDRPSTGFFEAVAAGIPALCLYYETIKIWDPMFRVFGKSLRKFSNTEEAIQIIEEFLNADPKNYAASLDLSINNAIDLLLQLQRGGGLRATPISLLGRIRNVSPQVLKN